MSSDSLAVYRRPTVLIAALCVLAAAFVVTSPARAAFPGANGRIAFGDADSGPVLLKTATPGGGDVQTLTEMTPSSRPKWSPDGSTLVFVGQGAGEFSDEIWTVKADGSNLRQLTHLNRSVGSPAWSPDGQRVVFRCDREVCTISAADGTDLKTLTTDASTANDDAPVWSPNGSQIAYAKQLNPTQYSDCCPHVPNTAYQIWVMGSDGTAQHRLTGDAGTGYPQSNHPDWSADGTKLVFDRTPDPRIGGGASVWVMHTDGSAQTQLTHETTGSTESSTQPVFSPDGTRIAFSGQRPDNQDGIYVMDPNGLDPQLVIAAAQSTSVDVLYGPSWQPVVTSPKPPHPPPVAKPSASFVVSPHHGRVGHHLRFDSSRSKDSDGRGLAYEWTFGDGTTAHGRIVRHTFHHRGPYTVRLTVTDHLGRSAQAHQQIAIHAH